MTDLDGLQIQFYAVSGVLGFFIIALIAAVINLYVKVYNSGSGKYEDDEEDDPRFAKGERPAPPPVKSNFTLPKPSFSQNWQDNEAEIRRQNEEKEHRIPKPDLSKSWNAYPGDRNGGRNQPRQQYNDPRYDDNTSNYSYDGRKSPVSKNSESAFRNPLSASINNELESRFEFPDNRSSRPKPPGLKSTYQQRGNNNFGFRSDLQRNSNNYY